ncbi:MAG TPA: hybrid sensor histidine kinase/response regulator [Ohtaekwangia sp.]|nr:hybrid sensor histidine kinase/response regulator [Ohtaekwangia sp.]
MERDLKILMLEDLPEDIGLIEHILRKEGIHFESRYADTKDEYVKALEEFLPDVILSDHALPQFNSVEALTICRKNSLNTPFILVTGTVSEEFAVSCLKQGADDYVLKSNLVRLPTAIVNALKQRNVEYKRKKAERTLRKQNEELVKINKELDSFVYSVSHNLRAPLMSVLGLLRLAQVEVERFGKENNILLSYFGMMEHSINKLDDTLKEILDYSRNARSEIKNEKVDLKALIEDGFDRLKYHEGSEQIEKLVNIEEHSVFCSDPNRLSVVLNNLISNSIKYRDLHKKNQYIKIQGKVNETMARIEFHDNGIGIPEELLNKIYDMFFRATERSEGAGLGLYIVKETIEKLGGRIETTSEVGSGTSFILEIPNRI